MRHKLPYLYGVDLRSAVAECFGWLPDQVRFVNDADAFLLGEIGAGLAQIGTRTVGITLGTGVGSAFAVNGRVVTEGSGVPSGGEIWNLPYENSTVEDFVSSRAIQRSYERRGSQSPHVVDLAMIAGDDPAANECFIEFGYHLGRVLHSILSNFAPNIVVLGGGISRSAHLFLPTAQRELDGLSARVVVSTLLDHAPLVGAGVAWFAELPV
jgi:glucokinase